MTTQQIHPVQYTQDIREFGRHITPLPAIFSRRGGGGGPSCLPLAKKKGKGLAVFPAVLAAVTKNASGGVWHRGIVHGGWSNDNKNPYRQPPTTQARTRCFVKKAHAVFQGKSQQHTRKRNGVKQHLQSPTTAVQQATATQTTTATKSTHPLLVRGVSPPVSRACLSISSCTASNMVAPGTTREHKTHHDRHARQSEAPSSQERKASRQQEVLPTVAVPPTRG